MKYIYYYPLGTNRETIISREERSGISLEIHYDPLYPPLRVTLKEGFLRANEVICIKNPS